jgi:AGZA family xanthine/uracil permease-like MFS transporter
MGRMQGAVWLHSSNQLLVLHVDEPAPLVSCRTSGITAFVLGCCFVVAMFFAPIFSSIPGYAMSPMLVVVGTMLMGHARDID